MRKLYLVPTIHMSADMGSLALALNESAAAGLGKEFWQEHKEIVSGLWDSIAHFFNSLNVKGFKIYQDGLVADGEEGLKIVTQGSKEGSRNYEVVSHLVERGAILVKTEDVQLIKKEYNLIIKMAQAKSFRQREIAAMRYRLTRGRLLEQRDSVIAAKINETLKEGETGILFVGAYHNVLPKLIDIKVIQVKEVTKAKEYHKVLVNSRKSDRNLRQLGEYLISPVSGIGNEKE